MRLAADRAEHRTVFPPGPATPPTTGALTLSRYECDQLRRATWTKTAGCSWNTRPCRVRSSRRREASASTTSTPAGAGNRNVASRVTAARRSYRLASASPTARRRRRWTRASSCCPTDATGSISMARRRATRRTGTHTIYSALSTDVWRSPRRRPSSRTRAWWIRRLSRQESLLVHVCVLLGRPHDVFARAAAAEVPLSQALGSTAGGPRRR